MVLVLADAKDHKDYHSKMRRREPELAKGWDKLSTLLLYGRLEALRKRISPIWKECSALSSQSPPRRPNPSSAPDAVALPSSRHKCAPRYTSCTEALQIWPKSCPSVHLLDRRTLPVSVFLRKYNIRHSTFQFLKGKSKYMTKKQIR